MIAAIVYGSFAPFHTARLEAAGAFGTRDAHRLVGIEVAGQQHEYRWARSHATTTSFRRLTLFPDEDYWSIPYARVQARLWRALAHVRPDVVLLPGWSFKESVAGLAWSLAHRVPRIVISDSQPTDRPRAAAKEWLKSRVVRRFGAGFAGGTPHVRYLVRLGLPASRCFTGCDVVDNDWFARHSQRRGTPRPATEPVTALSCVRLVPSKNIPAVLEVLAQRQPCWRWLIAGHGPQQGELERLIARLGLTERVHLLGHVAYPALPELYARADVYLQPSLAEPWGLAVNEAMASGLPVLVSNRCGCAEDLVVDGDNGFTFDPGTPDGIGAALDRFHAARDRWPEMGAASSARIAAWGLDLFARNLWRASATAVRAQAGRRRHGRED